jgi:hypothetical protein
MAFEGSPVVHRFAQANYKFQPRKLHARAEDQGHDEDRPLHEGLRAHWVGGPFRNNNL